MYILKQQPTDFIVTEQSSHNLSEDGKFAYFTLKKTNLNTLDAVRIIAKALNIKEKQVGFAGSKDKNAVTSQVCSIPKNKKEQLLSLSFKNIEITFLGYQDEPVSLGNLEENQFEIIVRNLDDFTIEKIKYLANYFDEQRFSLHNKDIGKHIIKKEFKEAIKLIKDSRSEEHLERHEKDYVGAIKKLPKRLLMMYVHAYQSYLWNRTLAEYLRTNTKVLKTVKYSLGEFVFVKHPENYLDLNIPMIGFGSENLEPEQVQEIIYDIMLKENLSYMDFVVKQIPELSLEGGLRKAFTEIKNLETGKIEEDDLNYGMKKVKFIFTLGKGSYATLAIKKIITLE